MSWWSRLWRRETRSEAPAEENILVISDIHLGEDVLIGGPEHLAGYIRALNKELAEFIAAHTERGPEGRQWHLVINGDMFDFVKVSVRPDPEEAYELWSREGGPARELDPIPNTPENVVWKLGRILEIHRPLFKRMALFLLRGHRITIIEGNHDAEFFFEEVQDTLRDFLVREAERQHRRERGSAESFDAGRIAKAVRFHAWFVASAGRYHIEHGHQYDELCSFEYKLAPLEQPGANTVAVPISHRIMPYLADKLGDFSTHGIDQWSLGRWARYVMTIQPKMMWELAKAFIPAMWSLLSTAGRRRRELLSAMSDVHDARLRWLAEHSPYGYQTLRILDRFKATPAEYSMAKTLRIFYLDRFILTAGWGVLMLLALGVGGTLGWSVAVSSTCVWAGLLWAVTYVDRPDVNIALREAAASIADETGARYVVFGHSHHPELIDLRERYGIGRYGESAYYINSGSWVTREILLGQEGNGMTYVEISSRGAALKRWVGTSEEPVVLAGTEADSATEPEQPSAVETESQAPSVPSPG